MTIATGSPAAGQEIKARRVATLYPFDNNISGTDPLDAALRSFGQDVLFGIEYLNTLSFSEKGREEAVAQYLRSKYESQKVDAVVAAGIGGLRFALKHGPSIFGDVPVVFVGVERSWLEDLHLPANVTGVAHFDDVEGTVNAALRMQPATTEVVVVTGTAEVDQHWLRHDRRIFDRMAGRVRFRYLTDLPLFSLLRELRVLKPGTIVFFHSFYRDGAGQSFSGPEVWDLVTRNSNSPIYSIGATRGFVGGGAGGEDDQRFAVMTDVLRRVLTGEAPSAIPIQPTRPPYPYTFDARELQRWNIDSSRIPPGSLLLNQQPTFWQQHWRLVLGVLSFIALESVLIAVLLMQRARRRKAEVLLADRNERLQESERSLRDLSGQLIDAQEEERKRIARELHDDLNQQVADIGICLSNIKRGIPTELENARGEIASVQNRLLTLSDAMRHMSHELHPGILELFGLVAALRSHCREFAEVTSIPVELQAECDEPVPISVALCVYRVTQESLRNAAKHSHASKVQVDLTKSGNLLRLAVSDDGVGFAVDKASASGGLGLRSMKERVRQAHGDIDVTSFPHMGTTVTVAIELKERVLVKTTAGGTSESAGSVQSLR